MSIYQSFRFSLRSSGWQERLLIDVLLLMLSGIVVFVALAMWIARTNPVPT
ncbi:MAG: hypothetical protein AAGK09_08175 [Planctomycetota bacterium]